MDYDFDKLKADVCAKFLEFLLTAKSNGRLKNPADEKYFANSLQNITNVLESEYSRFYECIPESERRKKREGDFKAWFAKFDILINKHFQEYPRYIENSSSTLNSDYWLVIDEYIRPFLDTTELEEPRVNIFKMISCTELVIMHRLPILHDDEQKQYFLNAMLALFIGKEMLSVYNGNCEVDFTNTIAEEDHFKWLQMVVCDPTYPYFLNAQTWRHFDTILHLQQIIGKA